MKSKRSILFFGLGNGLVNELSGGMIMAYETMRQLVAADYAVTFAVTPGGRSTFHDYFANDAVTVAGVELVDFKASIMAKKEPFRLYRVISYFITSLHAISWALCTRRRFDLVYASSDFFFDVFPSLVLKRRQQAKRLIGASFHRYPPPASRQGLWILNAALRALQQLSLWLLSRAADGYIFLRTAAGTELVADLRSLGYKGPAIMVPGGLQLKHRQLLEPKESFDLIHIGMRPNKGIYDLPQILQALDKSHPGLRLGCIGAIAPHDLARLSTELAHLGLQDRVSFLGRISEAEKNGLINAARVFIAPSHEEGWGIGVAEAISLGIPAVGYTLPAYAGAFGDGLLYATCFDAEHFASQIARLLSDDNLYAVMAARGRAVTTQYDWSAVLQEELAMLAGLA